jgi:threonine dehydrogenase-like Zn-dependent dehydrogenase
MTAGASSAQAAVLSATRSIDIRRIDVEKRPAAGGWLAVEACGMCGSDWNWFANRAIPSPFIPGHEIVGTVVESWGEAADRPVIRVGARIVLEEAIPCGGCAVCRSGRHRICPRGGRYGKTPLREAPSLWGGYAETVFLSPFATAHPVPPGLDSELATLFVPLSNGLSWLRSAGELRPGESVLVVGPGQHGLACVAAAKRLGAGAVIVAGQTGDGSRLAIARSLGADVTVDVDRRPLAEAVWEVVDATGVDVIVDATPTALTTTGEAVAMAAIGGRVIVAGVKNGALSPIDTDRLHQREITIKGVAARESWAIDSALAWLAAEPSTFEPFGSLRVGLDGVTDALLALGGEAGPDRPLHAVVAPRC